MWMASGVLHSFPFAFLAIAFAAAAGAEPLKVGSKRFTESYVLGEILTQSSRRAGEVAEHRPGLGNTAIVFEAHHADR